MKQMSLRIEDRTFQKLSTLGKNPTEAIQTIAEISINAYQRTRQELKGIFSKAELLAITSRYNGYIPNYELDSSTEIFVFGMEDFEKYDLIPEKIDFTVFLEKCSKLTSFQVAVIVRECSLFWYDNTSTYYQDFDIFYNSLA